MRKSHSGPKFTLDSHHPTQSTLSLNLGIYFYKKLWHSNHWNYITQYNTNIFRGTTLFRHKCCFHYLSLISIFISIWYSVCMTGRWFGLSIGGIWTRPCRLLEIWHHHSRCPRRPRRRHVPHTPAAPQSLPARTRPCPTLVVMSIKILDWCYRITASKLSSRGPEGNSLRKNLLLLCLRYPIQVSSLFFVDQAGRSRVQWSIFQTSCYKIRHFITKKNIWNSCFHM